MHIAILDDDASRTGPLQAPLIALGHTCLHFRTGAALLGHLQEDGFDLLVIDWQAANTGGPQLIRAVRDKLATRVPVLLLSGRDEADIIAALDAGADDYLVKPVRRGEIATRVQVLLRRAYPEHSAGEFLRFGPYGFETQSARLTRAGKTLDITHKEFALALLFFRNLGRPLSRAYLLEAIWARQPDLASRTMDTHVSRVRSKLGLRPENGYRLVPVYSYGYRLEQVSE
jgi:DNA-binding response OmpR family regulator